MLPNSKNYSEDSGVDDLDVLRNWIPQDPTDVEVWYPYLQQHTFNTRFVPLSYEHARVLTRFHENDMKAGDEDVIQELTKRVDKCIRGFKVKAAFVRLSTLSPKDATLLQSAKLFKLMKEQLEGVPINDQSVEICRINHAIYLASKVSSGIEAMELFRLSNRVAGHLKNRLEKTEKKKWCMNIVVREWSTIRPEFEFRTFVFGKRITAITHYYKFLFVEEIVLYEKKIAELILDYFENSIVGLVPLENYVIDFTVDPHTGFIKVIELNPWCDAASAALFDWENEEENEILRGKRPFEFRILEVPKIAAFDGISSQLRIMYWTLRPRAEEKRAQQVKDVQNFINESPYRKTFHKILKSETKKFELVANLSKKTPNPIDLDSLFGNIAIHEYGFVHWILSESFCESVGCVKSKQFLHTQSAPHKRNFFATITALIVYTLSRISKKEKNMWKEKTFRAFAYLIQEFTEEKKDQERRKRRQLKGEEYDNTRVEKEEETEKEEVETTEVEKEKGKEKEKENTVKGKEKEKAQKEDEKDIFYVGDVKQEEEVYVTISEDEMICLFSNEVYNCLVSLVSENSLLSNLIVRQ
eukprot:TRINITY_DN8208_c0_g1_i2.p1 TRINITY_DN8208_c0_g1~~TRINITY_DN8208_c0_g1_i2.p1  ORF type:complete len:584 (-),score=135.50 TRINITY_DN8208_c0_g1_i2:21-1772(-)